MGLSGSEDPAVGHHFGRDVVREDSCLGRHRPLQPDRGGGMLGCANCQQPDPQNPTGSATRKNPRIPTNCGTPGGVDDDGDVLVRLALQSRTSCSAPTARNSLSILTSTAIDLERCPLPAWVFSLVLRRPVGISPKCFLPHWDDLVLEEGDLVGVQSVLGVKLSVDLGDRSRPVDVGCV